MKKAIFFSLAIATCHTANAQSGNVQQKDSKDLNEVVISGQNGGYTEKEVSTSLRLNTPILETPQNIQVVTRSMLKDQQVISMSDGLIRNVSGLVRMEHWGDMYTNITARGSQIQALRNGFNVVNSYWGPLTEDMSFVENIEFVKGPAGFMISSGDPSGLYNVVTKKPTGETKGEATVTMGSFDLYRAALDLDGKLSKDGRLLYRINMAAQNKKSYRPNEYNNRYAIAPVISYQLDQKTKLTFEYNYQRANMSNVGSYYIFDPKGFATKPVGFTMLPAGLPGVNINDHSFYVNLQHSINDNWKVTAQAARFIYNQVGSSAWPGVVNPDGTIIRNIGIWDSRSRMSMGQLFLNGEVRTGFVNHKILAGLDMANKEYIADWSQSHDLDDTTNYFDLNDPAEDVNTVANGYPVFDRSMPLEQRAQAGFGYQNLTSTSLYVQDELGFFDNKLRLTLAGRFTDLKQAYAGPADKAQRFTPRAGLSFSFDRQTAIYALYDQAFVPQTGILTNGDKVQPVTGNNMEIGVKRQWMNGRWTTGLTGYRIIKNNELIADPAQAPTSGLSIEMGQKLVQGVEFDLRGTITRGLNIVVNYAYTNSTILELAPGITTLKEGDVVPGFAKHTANAWLTYRIQSGVLKGFGISGGASFLGDRATYWDPSPTGGQGIKDYFKVDAGLSWEGEKMSINANVFNVLNEYLYSGSYNAWLKAYSWQTDPPRNLRLSVAYRF
jgi:iron complex outermembrane receptor protein